MANEKILALIPARSGSKRLKNKNTLDICGKPLIAWSIEAATGSRYIDEIVVSSDGSEILELANKFGAKTILRPSTLASDTSTTVDVVKHIIEHYKKDGYEYILVLQPTSPLRESIDIDNAIELLKEKKADAIVSVCKTPHSPLWMNTIPLDLSMNDFIKNEVKNKRSQELDTYYMLNGAIYLFEIDRFMQEETLFFKDNIFAYIMDTDKSIDIDTLTDFKIANLFLEEREKKNI